MDSTAARRAVAKVLGQDGETAHEYLEKLFQTTFAVPAPRARDAFVDELLKYHDLPRRDGLAGKICDLAEPNPRKLKSFVAGLAAGWSVYGADRGEEEIERFLLLHYLRSYHPDVYRLLSYDPEQVATLWKVLSEGLEQMEPGASSVAYFFLAAFEHAAEAAFGDQEEVTREGRSAVASQLTRRLDRHKGDRAFIALWQSTLKDGDGADAVSRLRPFLELMSPEEEA